MMGALALRHAMSIIIIFNHFVPPMSATFYIETFPEVDGIGTLYRCPVEPRKDLDDEIDPEVMEAIRFDRMAGCMPGPPTEASHIEYPRTPSPTSVISTRDCVPTKRWSIFKTRSLPKPFSRRKTSPVAKTPKKAPVPSKKLTLAVAMANSPPPAKKPTLAMAMANSPLPALPAKKSRLPRKSSSPAKTPSPIKAKVNTLTKSPAPAKTLTLVVAETPPLTENPSPTETPTPTQTPPPTKTLTLVMAETPPPVKIPAPAETHTKPPATAKSVPLAKGKIPSPADIFVLSTAEASPSDDDNWTPTPDGSEIHDSPDLCVESSKDAKPSPRRAFPSLTEKPGKGADLPLSSLQSPRNFQCIRLTSYEERLRIYERTNFYLVAFPKLEGGKRFDLADATTTPQSFLLGVPLVGEKPDWPLLLDGRRDDVPMVVSLVRHMCKNMLQPQLLAGVSLDSIAAFLSTSDFRHFAYPNPRTVARFKAFAQLLSNVRAFAAQNLPRKRHKKEVVSESTYETLDTAVRFLVQKLVDPCFMVRHRRKADPVAAEEAEEADDLCSAQCKFLAVGISLFPTRVPGCTSIFGGRCRRVCTCFRNTTFLRCIQCGTRAQRVNMVKCSNALRFSIPPLFSPASSSRSESSRSSPSGRQSAHSSREEEKP